MATTGVTTTAETQASTVEQTTLRPTPSTTTPAPVTTTQPTTTADPVTTTSTTPSPVVQSSSAAPTTSVAASPSTSSTTTSTAAPVTSSTTTSSTPSTTPLTSSSTTTSSTTTQQSTQIVTVTQSNVSVPGLVTNVSAVPISSSTSKALAENSKGGVGGSGLPLGGLIGIIIGALAVLIIAGLLITRSMRKRARAKRTASRSSLFEPWPAPVAMEDEPYEKPAYDAGPAQSYPMQNATNELYSDSAYPAYGTQGGYQQYNDYPAQPYGAYPPQPYADLDAHNAAGLGAAAMTGAAGEGVEAVNGIHDGMMVRVKVAFVRSLEDELAITPGQQLYLHTAYDDGWTLCEDQAQNRGVVPVSCLEPWEENAAENFMPEQNDQSLNPENTAQRRSSLYANQQ